MIQKLINIFDRYPRQYFIYIFFGIFCFVIISRTFSYSVSNYDFYKSLADKQHIGTIKLPVNRGTIYGKSLDVDTTLATSVYLDNLSIDPTATGNRGKMINVLTDLIYSQICEGRTFDECYKSLVKFLKVLEIENYNGSEEQIKTLLLNELTNKSEVKPIVRRVLATNLSSEIGVEIERLGLPGIYFSEGTLSVNPEEIGNDIQRETIARQLSEKLNQRYQDIAPILNKGQIRYTPIIKRLSIETSEKLNAYMAEEREAVTKGIIKREDAMYPFIILEAEPARYYPEEQTGSQIIGFLDMQGNGNYGIEGYFDNILKGEAGKIVSKKDSRGRILDPIEFDKDAISARGANIYLTIDRNVQQKAEEIIEEHVKAYRANKGSIVVMNPNTGKVLALANYPTYDPNYFGDVYEIKRVSPNDYQNMANELLGKEVLVVDSEKGERMYLDGKELFLRTATREEIENPILEKYIYKNEFGARVYSNDAVSGLYESGSIMKPLIFAVGIDTGEITPEMMYQDDGSVKIDQFTIKNVSNSCLGYNTFQNAMNYSCNVGMIRIAQRVGMANFYNYFKNFGFGEKTGINLSGEASGSFPHYSTWSRARLYTMSYGLGIAVTPLQMATSYSTIVNGGVYVKPNIIEKIEFADGKILEFEPEITHRVLKEETSQTMKEVLIDSATRGYAKTGAIPGYIIGGKTGTAQIATRGGYESGHIPGSVNVSYAGFGPAQDPQFVIVVRIERPRTTGYSETTSAYVFRDMMDFLVKHFSIPKVQ